MPAACPVVSYQVISSIQNYTFLDYNYEQDDLLDQDDPLDQVDQDYLDDQDDQDDQDD